VANREQRGNKEKRKPKADKPKPPVAQTSSLARRMGIGSVNNSGPKKKR